MTCRLFPANRATSAGSCVATPERAALPALARRVARLRAREVALPQHRAAQRHQQRRPEAHPVGAEQHQLERVLAREHAAVDAHLDPLAHPLLDEHVLHRGQHRRHRDAAVLLVHALRRARAAAAVREVEAVRSGVDATHARHLHAVRGHELERGAHVGVEVAPALDHELDVLDRVEVVVHGRRDELVARLAAALARDARGHLLPRELAALARLRPLGELHLRLGRSRRGHRRHREARPRVLDAAVAVGSADAGLVEAALAAVRDRADPRRDRHPRPAEARPAVAVERVHRPRDRAVRRLRERALAHPRGHEAPEHVLLPLDLVEREGLAVRARPCRRSSMPSGSRSFTVRANTSYAAGEPASSAARAA